MFLQIPKRKSQNWLIDQGKDSNFISNMFTIWNVLFYFYICLKIQIESVKEYKLLTKWQTIGSMIAIFRIQAMRLQGASVRRQEKVQYHWTMNHFHTSIICIQFVHWQWSVNTMPCLWHWSRPRMFKLVHSGCRTYPQKNVSIVFALQTNWVNCFTKNLGM